MKETNPLSSQLFTVRVWTETLSDDRVEVRFQAKHVLSGESRIFRKGEQLLQYLLAKMGEVER